MPQLEELIKSKIDEDYRDKIELTTEQDLFYDVIASAIRALVSGLESKVDGSFKAMDSINWGSMEMLCML